MLEKLKLFRFFGQVKQECLKVVWPNKSELTTSVLVVLVSVFVCSFAVLFADYGIHFVINFLLNLGK